MLKILLILLLTLLTTNNFAQEQLSIRKKIIPLHTNRAEVENVARFVKNFSNFTRYETDNEFLDIYYSETKCVGHGWSIPADKVISYRSYPKRKLLSEEVNRINMKFFKYVDDTLTNHLINSLDGIEFVIKAREDTVEYIGFSPAVTDSNLRCKGFPEYDLVSEHYSPYQIATVKNISDWDVGLIYATLFQVEKNQDHDGYIFIYCKEGQISKCQKLKSKIEKVAGNVLKDKINQLDVAFGGYRNEVEIETFLVPKNYPPAVSRPTLPLKK